MTQSVLFPGSYDPFTLGHYDLAIRALGMFDQVIIAVGDNMQKKTMFSLQQRIDFIRSCFKDDDRVEVISYRGLTGEYCRQAGIGFILRGVRNESDFAYESNIAQVNAALWEGLETILLVSRPEHAFISSSVVREILHHGGDASQFLPANTNLPEP